MQGREGSSPPERSEVRQVLPWHRPRDATARVADGLRDAGLPSMWLAKIECRQLRGITGQHTRNDRTGVRENLSVRNVLPAPEFPCCVDHTTSPAVVQRRGDHAAVRFAGDARLLRASAIQQDQWRRNPILRSFRVSESGSGGREHTQSSATSVAPGDALGSLPGSALDGRRVRIAFGQRCPKLFARRDAELRENTLCVDAIATRARH